jgi:hypothetical protein
VFTRDRNLHLGWLTCRRLSDAAPALVNWLSGKGCTGFKYELGTGLAGNLAEEE